MPDADGSTTPAELAVMLQAARKQLDAATVTRNAVRSAGWGAGWLDREAARIEHDLADRRAAEWRRLVGKLEQTAQLLGLPL
jgi:hypothetical protein